MARRMLLEELKKRFMGIVAPSLPNEWEVEEVLGGLEGLPSETLDAVFEQVAVIWPVSHSLCFVYLSDGHRGFTTIPLHLFAEWSRKILELYEATGLIAARKFICEPENRFLAGRQGLCGVHFTEIAERMQYYLNGVSGRELRLDTGPVPTTDTGRIFVPEVIDVFPSHAENSLLYKLIVSLQFIHIELRHYEEVFDSCEGYLGTLSSSIFSTYTDKRLAQDLLLVIWFVRAYGRLYRLYPGLHRVSAPLCIELVNAISTAGDSTERGTCLKEFLLNSLGDVQNVSKDFQVSGSQKPTLELLPQLYDTVYGRRGDYSCGFFSYLLGTCSFAGAAVEIEKRREEQKNTFVSLLSMNIGGQGEDVRNTDSPSEITKTQSDTTLLLIPEEDGETIEKTRAPRELLLENGVGELSDELKALIASIEHDLGELPEAYVQAAVGMAGKGVNSRDSDIAGENEKGVADPAGFSYDEWDYRREGYRKSWCTLYEKTVSPVKSTIIEETLSKYKGQLHKIRRQFEMLRTKKRYVRRRRHGDDIDFDALVDAHGDSKAGLVPSDRLFMRLLRDQREISSCFLVDMSNSTEGWVGTAVKESLILMSEAMEIVGDPYAIYGFSGMRRSKSEVYPIKELAEKFSDLVRERIAGVAPKEYTRMGPPIRHMTRKLLECESKIRLLIIFSDGKPEDYDDYKGQYAIEDTRKAILEAKGVGIHVFCVTIDSTAHDYLDHMYGGGQYVYIDNVDMLPGKMVELYRLLTC